jgi:hypothetical protein
VWEGCEQGQGHGARVWEGCRHGWGNSIGVGEGKESKDIGEDMGMRNGEGVDVGRGMAWARARARVWVLGMARAWVWAGEWCGQGQRHWWRHGQMRG